MLKTPSIIGACLLAVCLWTIPSAQAAVVPDDAGTPLSEWEVRVGDRLLVDTKENMGYLIHEDGTYTVFLLATGVREVVRYIGRIYNAATPTKHWIARSREIKGDRITFGPQGVFLRLYDNGERTPYGIHSHRSIKAMLADDSRFKSMGCILVSEEILALIEHTIAVNDGTLAVETTYGVGNETYAMNKGS